MIRHATKYIHEGHLVAEVDIDLEYTDDEWSPYLSVADALKLDEVRAALRAGDIRTAAQYAKIYQLTPVSA
ncbi:MAG: hypothetical protein KDE20_04105 [Caldilineaceae bacterium]|nr:hypothetical protein [Caldilineaceae bacterium]